MDGLKPTFHFINHFIDSNFTVKRASLVGLYAPAETMAPVDFRGINPKKFTIGLEIEMVIPDLLKEERFRGDCYEFVSRALKTLAEDMGTGVMAYEAWFQPPFDVHTWSKRFRLFQVKNDSTILSKNVASDGLIEIATPILKNEAWDWVVPRLCESMRCAAQFAGTKLSFNRTTGLHVHIAIDGRPFTLAELRRISKAVLIFERHMSHFHPKCRRGNRIGVFQLELCRDSRSLQDLSDEEALDLIDTGSSLEDIIYNMNGLIPADVVNGEVLNGNLPSRYFKCNFTPLDGYGTIEFREAMGTDNEYDILDWIKTIIKFITAAMKTPDYLFADWVRNGIPPVVYLVFGVPRPPGYRKWNRDLAVENQACKMFAPRYGRK